MYYLYQYNLVINSFTKTTYNIQTNVKYIYLINSIFLMLLLVIRNFKKLEYPLLTYLLVLVNSTYFSVFIIVVFLNLLVLNFTKNTLIKPIHILILMILYFTQQQLYIFYYECIRYNLNSIKFLKTDGVFTSTRYYLFSIIDLNYLNKNSQITLDLYKNNFDFLLGVSKNVFEKSVLILNNIFLELYNYNLQKLTQVDGFNIFVSLLLLLLYVIFFKRGKKKNTFF